MAFVHISVIIEQVLKKWEANMPNKTDRNKRRNQLRKDK